MTERASFDETLDFCNKVRDAGGANPLDALMPAIPQKQNACLIALNLNFSCSVSPRYGTTSFDFQPYAESLGYTDDHSDPIWTMNVQSEEIAKNIGNALSLPVVDVSKRSFPSWAIGLPKSIALVARDFDEWIENPEEFAEFEPYVKDSVKTRMDELFDLGQDYDPREIQ